MKKCLDKDKNYFEFMQFDGTYESTKPLQEDWNVFPINCQFSYAPEDEKIKAHFYFKCKIDDHFNTKLFKLNYMDYLLKNRFGDYYVVGFDEFKNNYSIL
ncbi:hypothetical protein [Apilactobacillus micheneri]|uniref:hypothetical protein n=1 Tax=Apilactobacillus micheneri TaxID=1899430 RepID=UPI00112AC329|nr:hypothetical protein [Apilactobacillus micheneri]TPR40427.1 hypothetical protein DY119_01685 [Apilactobacillus micheneri]